MHCETQIDSYYPLQNSVVVKAFRQKPARSPRRVPCTNSILFRLALACSLIALEYDEENTEAEGNLVLLKNRYPDVEPASEDEFTNYLKECDIRGVIDSKRVKVLRDLAERTEEENYEMAIDLWINLEKMTGDEEIHQHIHELMHRMEETYEMDHGAHYDEGHCCGHGHQANNHDGNHCCGRADKKEDL